MTKAKTAALPDWARRGNDGAILVDPGEVYPMYLAKLGVEKPDQFGLEVARWCFTADLFDLGLMNGEESLHLHIGRDLDWRLDKFPNPAKTSEALDAKVRAEWRRHYKRLEPLVDAGALTARFVAAHKGGTPIKLPKHPAIRAACEAYKRA